MANRPRLAKTSRSVNAVFLKVVDMISVSMVGTRGP